MAERSQPRPRAPARGPVTLEDLRPLLVGPEQGRIERLEERLDRGFAETVAGVLPEATATSRKQGEGLALALEPIVDACARKVLTRDPGGFAEVIAPALGPAIRKAVSQALRAALQRLNVALENTLSVQSIRWRIEARRTGRTFAEVALLRTLVYRVEQVFLIHRETGLLLEHQTSDEEARDPDQIAAMLSALETFTREAFREDARLERFRVGELAGWVEHGPSAIVAAIVRGTAPEEYERVLREAVERVHVEHGKQLAEFRGDTAAFAAARETLAACLREHHELPRKGPRLSPRAAIVLLAVLGAIVAGLCAHRAWRDERLFAAYLSALKSEPGLVVTEAEWGRERRVFTGLRDVLAPDPSAVLARSGLDPAHVSVQLAPFLSLDPRIVERRAQSTLRPPEGASLTLHEGVLTARGVAPRAWIEKVRSAVPLMPGIAALDDGDLVAREAIDLDRAREAARAIERMEIHFAPGSTEIGEDQRAIVEGAARAAEQLLTLAKAAGWTASIEVLGHVDPSGPRATNEALARSRAERVADELGARGVPADRIRARGGGVLAGVPPGDGGAWRARSVRFRVDLRSGGEE